MASRMDRYYDSSKLARSIKNKDLYKKAQNIDVNSIDAVEAIKRSNEIDINKVKDIINNREKYKKEKKLRQTIDGSKLNINVNTREDKRYNILDVKPERIVEEQQDNDEIKNYDVVDVLSKAKNDRGEINLENRNLKDLEYADLNSLNLHNKEYKDSEAELKDLINTIHNTSKLSKLGDDVGLLDELKSNTSVGDVSSIKKVLEETSQVKKDDTKELDKSFFTNTFDFKDEDFDERLAIKHSKKKKIIIAIIISLIVAITLSALYFFRVFNF